MKINSAELGEIEINEDDIIYFKEGIYGFENIHKYVLLNLDDDGSIISMQSAEGVVPSFILLDPYIIYQGFSPKISKTDLKYFDCTNIEDLRYLVVAVIKENFNETVVNIKSPIAINSKTRIAKQVILENNDYPLRYHPFENN